MFLNVVEVECRLGIVFLEYVWRVFYCRFRGRLVIGRFGLVRVVVVDGFVGGSGVLSWGKV